MALNEQYQELYEKLQQIVSAYEQAESRLEAKSSKDEAAIQRRIRKLHAQLKRIKETSEKLEYFQTIAEKHITSRNTLAITEREVDFRRLRDWTSLIDATSNDDPHAQRVYVLTRCNQLYLENKKKQFEQTLAELERPDDESQAELRAQVEETKSILTLACRRIVESEEFDRLAEELQKLHRRYSDLNEIVGPERRASSADELIGIGASALPLPVVPELKAQVKLKLGAYYDDGTGCIFRPLEIPESGETILSVSCSPDQERRLYRGLQNYLLNVIARADAGERSIQILDALHYNNTSLGQLKSIEKSIFFEPIPRDGDALMDALKLFVMSFADIDEQIGMAESVREYNAGVSADRRIPCRTLVLVGYPSVFPEEGRKLVNRILLNREHYGVSVILADTRYSAKQETRTAEIVDEIGRGTVRIDMSPNREIASRDGEDYAAFRWYELKSELFPSFVEHVNSLDVKNSKLGTVYARRVDLVNVPLYTRGRKSVLLPYGVDHSDEVHSIGFDEENFAAYLMGASGSGKSTLLHTLITGILRNYHPDDVELWLADFKMSEFAQYMDPLPPHVRYILLDESQELVYDLIDRLTEEMMKRQRFFMHHKDLKKVENVRTDVYMPVIFVILDEFSIMSQSVAENEYYKLRLQNLLAKGRALGIKFIFSSQTFTKGVSGLTSTAKEQIQCRIAMKNSVEEIDKTLELSSGTKTEQVKGWMDALPPHFALSKYREGDIMRVKRLQVMYFEGKGEKALAPQRGLIKTIRSRLHAVETYTPDDPASYVDKHAVIVDGNSFSAFTAESFTASVQDYRDRHPDDVTPEDILLSMGSPRRMVSELFIPVTLESRQNLLLIAGSNERACGMSVVYTAMRCFGEQGAHVQIWAYSKNRLYRAYQNSHFAGYESYEGIDAICDQIRVLKERILNQEPGRELIVLLGMEQICGDFELIDSSPIASRARVSADLRRAAEAVEVKTAEQEQSYREMQAFTAGLNALLDKIEEDGLEAGKSLEEIMAEQERVTEAYYRDTPTPAVPAEKKEQPSDRPEPDVTEDEQEEEAEKSGAYNALEDFRYVVRQGSRFGYHFLLCLNTLADLKPTRLNGEMFRHRMVFQLSLDDSLSLFNSRIATKLPEHICQYSDGLEAFSFRPFLHPGVTWDGWEVAPDGTAQNPNIL